MTERGLRYLALGDSYTVGEGVAAQGRWPCQLIDALGVYGIVVQPAQIIAVTGWTTDELDAGIDASAPGWDYDLVSLGIGVNNQYRARPLDEYRIQFSGLLERAIAFAGGRAARVLVLSIPDWGSTPFAKAQKRDRALISSEIDAFNTAAAVQCTQRGATFVDITPLSREYGMESAMLAADGLHPSAAMYALWVQLALPAVRHALT